MNERVCRQNKLNKPCRVYRINNNLYRNGRLAFSRFSVFLSWFFCVSLVLLLLLLLLSYCPVVLLLVFCFCSTVLVLMYVCNVPVCVCVYVSPHTHHTLHAYIHPYKQPARASSENAVGGGKGSTGKRCSHDWEGHLIELEAAVKPRNALWSLAYQITIARRSPKDRI